MKQRELFSALENWAPLSYAESFDNVGLLVGNGEEECKGVLVTLDCTEEVVQAAINLQYNTIVSFHPIIFKGLRAITNQTYVERAVALAIKKDIAIYALHTNLDAIKTGVNKKISEKLGLEQVQILLPKENSLYKLIFYIPPDSTESVMPFLYEAGAGTIGNYQECSFSSLGQGTFTPNQDAQPYIGQAHKAEKIEELKMEVLVEEHLLSKVLQVLKERHPYEEVAYEIIPTKNKNQDRGMGMIGQLKESLTEEAFFALLQKQFHLKCIRHSALRNVPIQKVAVLGGSGNFALQAAISQKADAYVSADFKYHEFFKAENKILIADIGHYESEQFTKELIFDYISKKFPNFAVQISSIITNPVYYYT